MVRGAPWGDYLLRVSEATHDELGAPARAVVQNAVQNGDTSVTLLAHCALQVDHDLDDDEVALDQTVRNAIGIPFGHATDAAFVCVGPLVASAWQLSKLTLARWLGARNVFVRVVKAHVPDMEKELARLSPDTFHLLGTRPGNVVVVEAVTLGNDGFRLAKRRVRAYELTDDIIEARQGAHKPSLSARFVDARGVLGINPDLEGIWLDAELRCALASQQVEPVRVRRDTLNVFMQEFRAFGVVFFLSAVAILQVLPLSRSWSNVLVVAGISMLIASGLILAAVRAGTPHA